ncbi:PD-(D/E)XK nuclease family transposase [Peptococcaceae bacterium CEB3]|nr:PD-(D/E)XK nuclease family transposase [Peptococcaceae bacterium CEB3]
MTITIDILNFSCFKETEDFHSIFGLYEKDKHFLLTDALAQHYIELPKLRKKWRQKEVTPQQDRLVRWLFLLDGNEDEEIRKQLEAIAVEDPMIDRAMKNWENMSGDPKLRELYFDRRKALMDRMAAARAAELKVQKAKAEGEAKGRADDICQYLEVRFGPDSQALQETIRHIESLDRLNRILRGVYTTGTLDEAKQVIQQSLDS